MAACKGRRVVVALTGGIACYKTAPVVSGLVQAGAQVRVLMTEAATKFIQPLTFQSLTGQAVITSIFTSDENLESPHIAIARWADVMVIAPTSADMIAKLAAGICDDVVSLVACALPRHSEGSHSQDSGSQGSDSQGNDSQARHSQSDPSQSNQSSPPRSLMLAPAMNADMWANPIVQRNLKTLDELLGVEYIGPGEGWQACRTSGAGRMSEPAEILSAIARRCALLA